MRPGSLRFAAFGGLLLLLSSCSASAFEPLPATPEAILAFRLRTLQPGRVIRIERMDRSVTEGRVLTAETGRVVLAGAARVDTVEARSVAVVWQRRDSPGSTIGKTALRAALGAGVVVALLLGVQELEGESLDVPVGYLAAFVVGKAAAAGTVLGAVAYASAPEWSRIYPIPAGSRP